MTGKSSFCTISHNFSHGFKIKKWQKVLLKSGVDLSLIHLVGIFLSVIINDRLIYKPGRDAALNIIKKEHVNLNRKTIVFLSRNSVKSHRNLYLCHLGLVERKVLFFNAQEKDPSLKQFDIDINELKSELIKLGNNVKALDDLLSIH